MPSRLNPDDLKRGEEYLQLPQNQVERRPFRPWLLLAIVAVAVIGMGLLSRLLSFLAL